VHDGRRRRAGRDDERLDVEAADEPREASPSSSVSMSPWYHESPNGALGTWMTKKSKFVFGGSPSTVTRMISTGPIDVTVTLARASGRHPAFVTAAERTIGKTIRFSGAPCARAVPAEAGERDEREERRQRDDHASGHGDSPLSFEALTSGDAGLYGSPFARCKGVWNLAR
jgi:hypothetical protein